MPKYVYNAETGEMTEEEILPADLNPSPIADLRRDAVAQVNQQADTQRGKIITLLIGKIGEYVQKQRAYDLWVSEQKPDPPTPGKYPIAELESQVRGLTIAEMLQIWGDRAAQWEQASAAITATEVGATMAIALAGTDEAINLIVSGLDWPF